MKNYVRKIEEFHKAFKIHWNDTPTIPDAETVRLRYNLGLEELQEFMDACQVEDPVKVFDALVDQLYILVGTAHIFGMADALEEGFREVHKSNMTKLDEQGKPVYREDGKVIKSHLYKKPELEEVLNNVYSV